MDSSHKDLDKQNEPKRSTLTTEAFWEFSLSVYMTKGMKDAFLALQNKFHGNVNLMLIFIWLDQQNLRVTETGIKELQQALHIVEPLLHQYRSLRHKYKPHLPDTLYRESLDFELQLEKMQQHDLITRLNQLDLYNNSNQKMSSLYCQYLDAEILAPNFSIN